MNYIITCDIPSNLNYAESRNKRCPSSSTVRLSVSKMCCRGGRLFPSSFTDPYWSFSSFANRSPGVAGLASPSGSAISTSSVIAFNRDQHLTCDVPHYVHLAAILSLCSVVVFKMAAAGKLAFLMIIAAAYVIVVEFVERPIFTQLDLYFIKSVGLSSLLVLYYICIDRMRGKANLSTRGSPETTKLDRSRFAFQLKRVCGLLALQ